MTGFLTRKIIYFNCLYVCLNVAGCAGIQKPNTVLYGVNGASNTLRGYNLRNYTENGQREANAPVYQKRISSLKDLNGWTCTDPTGFKNLKVFVGDLRDAYERERRN